MSSVRFADDDGFCKTCNKVKTIATRYDKDGPFIVPICMTCPLKPLSALPPLVPQHQYQPNIIIKILKNLWLYLYKYFS
jgi:hypothetical protein